MEDNLNIFENRRRPLFFQIGDNLNLIPMEYYLNMRQHKMKIIQPKTIKIKTMVVAPFQVT